AQHVGDHPSPLDDVAYSLATTRSALEHRLAVVASSRVDLRAQLDAAARGELPRGAAIAAATTRGKVAFVFTGQGAQRAGMGRALYARLPASPAALDGTGPLFAPPLDEPLLDVVWREGDDRRRLDQTAYTQAALFALEVALAAQLAAFGVHPDLLAG